MKYREFMRSEMFVNADVIDYLDENYEELDVIDDEDYFDCEVIEVNKSECVGVIEIVLKTN